MTADRGAPGEAVAIERWHRRGPLLWAAGVVVTLVLATVVSTWASSAPDGLERVAEDHGFAGSAEEHGLTRSPLADYAVDGVDDDGRSLAAAGAIGVAATGALAAGLLWVLRRPSAGSATTGASRPADG